MKLLHISDLHLGKHMNGFPLLEDQRHVLTQVLGIAREQCVDALMIAGDLYDKTTPAGAAVGVLDDFLTALLEMGVAVFLIAGNHDSPDRLQFGSRLFERNGLYIAARYEGACKTVALEDACGSLYIHMLPYIGRAEARRFAPDAEIKNHHDAVRVALAATPLVRSARNILITHQHVTPYAPGEGEQIVGELDNVDVTLFDAFDYVALGHIHKPYPVGRAQVRYSGTILTMSHKDALIDKGVFLVELNEKGSLRTEFFVLNPLRRVRIIKGPFDALLAEGLHAPSDDFFHATLTDELPVPDAMRRLRAAYPNTLHLGYDNARTHAALAPHNGFAPSTRSIPELFEEFYRLQNGQDWDNESRALFMEQLGAAEVDA